MQQKEKIRVGDTIECYKWHKAMVEEIKILSTGEFVEECEYNGNGYDIVLVLKSNLGRFKMCFKDAPVKIS